MSEIQFEGGFFDEAGIDVNDVADDPFGFGNDSWPVRVIEAGEAKVTANGDKVGMSIRFAVEHPKYDGHYVSTQGLGFGNWTRLPVPKALQGSIPWDPKNEPKDAKVLTDLKELFRGLGFRADEMGSVNGQKMLHRIALAKIKPYQDENGFWKFRIFNFKPMPEGGVPTTSGAANATAGKSAEELLREELAG